MSMPVSRLLLARPSSDLTQYGTLYTLGYASSGDRERLERLMHDHRRLLVDTRFSPWSRWYPAFQRQALHQRYNLDEQAHLPQAVHAVRYVWYGATLGNVNFQSGGPIRLANPVQGVQNVVVSLREGRDVILLCACADAMRCHRTLVAKLVQDALVLIS